MLLRDKNKIIYNWYTKDVASGRIMNFHSTQPLKQKINTATNLINKAIDISDEKFRDDNIRKFRKILKNNDYPNYIINDLIDKKLNPHMNTRSPQIPEQPGNAKQYFSIPYIPHLTSSRNLRTTITQESAIFAHKPNKTLSDIFSITKDRIGKEQQHNVVYEVTCKGNDDEQCKQVYIGTTKRALGVRLGEHEADIRNGRTNTALSQHILEYGHNADFVNAKILDKERRTNTRYTIESLRIQQKLTKTMNNKEDKDNTNSVYTVII